MRRRVVAAWVGCLALVGSPHARAQEPRRSLPAPQDGRARLRAEVIRLRVEVEALQLDYDIARVDLMEDLKTIKSMEMLGDVMQGVSEIQVAIDAQSNKDAGRAGTDARASRAEKGREAARRKKDEQEKAAYIAAKKKDLARLSTALAEKALDREDKERQYREPSADRPAVPVVDAKAGARVPILEPIPDGSSPTCCLDPPTEGEVWRKIAEAKKDDASSEVRRDNARFVIEKIGEKVDPVKTYPLAGPCQLVHCHYKCTVSFDEIVKADYPIPSDRRKLRTEVVYIDKDHLRRSVPAPASDVVRTSLPAMQTGAGSDPERRMERVEAKLDRILKALDDHRLGPRD